MEVTVNKSIEIPKTEKKRRPRIQDNKGVQVVGDKTNVVHSTNFKRSEKTNDGKPREKRDRKPNFVKPARRVRSVDEIKEGIIKSLESVGGKYVKFEDINHTEGLLVCGVVDAPDMDHVTDEDIYFAVVNHDRKLQYVNCNNRFSVQREPSLRCSILDWLYRNEAQTIVDIAMDTMEDDGVDIFTDTYLYVPVVEKKKPAGKKNKKNNKK